MLCKAAVKDVTGADEKDTKVGKKQDKLLGTHKGTGFVRFQNQADADTLLELS